MQVHQIDSLPPYMSSHRVDIPEAFADEHGCADYLDVYHTHDGDTVFCGGSYISDLIPVYWMVEQHMSPPYVVSLYQSMVLNDYHQHDG